MPAAARDVRPDTGIWSAANLVEHLATSERSITALVSGLVEGAEPRAEEEAFDRSAFERSISMPFILDRSRKIEGPQPSGELGAAEAWAALEASRHDLLAVLEGAAGLRLDDRTRVFPVTGDALNVYQWVAFASLHEGRHAAQLEEIAEAVAGDSAGSEV